MIKIEKLENKILKVIDEIHKEDKDIKISYESDYTSGRIYIKVTE